MQFEGNGKRKLLLVIPIILAIIACVGSFGEEGELAGVTCIIENKNLEIFSPTFSIEEYLDINNVNISINLKKEKVPNLFTFAYLSFLFTINLISIIIIISYMIDLEDKYLHLREVIFLCSAGKGYDCVG